MSTMKTLIGFSDSLRKVLVVLSCFVLGLVALTVFQDLLESKRIGIDFNLDESLLFKTVWLLFIPILIILYQRMQMQNLDSYAKMILYIGSAIAVHLLILPLLGLVFSELYFQGRYDLYKFFSFTMAHDLYKLVIVYTGFVLGFKLTSKPAPIIKGQFTDSILTNSGRETKLLKVEEIVQITSDTPYVCIHLKDKKYLHAATLKSICEQLDSRLFVRVHKTTVVNCSMVSSLTSRLNGDYDLMLTNGVVVRLSRTYAADFKKRFPASQRVEA